MQTHDNSYDTQTSETHAEKQECAFIINTLEKLKCQQLLSSPPARQHLTTDQSSASIIHTIANKHVYIFVRQVCNFKREIYRNVGDY